MSRAELVAILADLVKHKQLSLRDAQNILSAFDAGVVPDLAELPTLQERNHDDLWLVAFFAVMLLAGGSPARPLNKSQRLRVRKQARLQWEDSVFRLSLQVTRGALTIPTWMTSLFGALGSYARQMAIGGHGSNPPIYVKSLIDRQIAKQAPFLKRFGVQMAGKRLLGEPMTAANVSARTQQYGGTGWSSWFVGNETRPQLEEGYVVYYHARDDRRTCGPCHSADGESPYLPGAGPYPGEVCLGRGLCRCTREEVYDPAAWRRLTAQAQLTLPVPVAGELAF